MLVFASPYVGLYKCPVIAADPPPGCRDRSWPTSHDYVCVSAINIQHQAVLFPQTAGSTAPTVTFSLPTNGKSVRQSPSRLMRNPTYGDAKTSISSHRAQNARMQSAPPAATGGRRHGRNSERSTSRLVSPPTTAVPFWDNPVNFQVVFAQNGTAVLKGLGSKTAELASNRHEVRTRAGRLLHQGCFTTGS